MPFIGVGCTITQQRVRPLGVVEQYETTDASSEILLGFVLGTIEFFLLQNTEERFTDRISVQ